ncbi:MAG: ketoacyl-ACP synthase III [Tissierellia bacterium]|nr:ketoacyl-ACP synthase III [Tissierellia bacterium]
MENYSVGITGIGKYMPEDILTNDDLSKMVETSNEWIVERTGIEERRIAKEHISTSDLATEAARAALEDANLKPEDIDLIIVATATADHAFPSTACIIQSNLGMVNAAAFDLSAACSGFVYGLATGASFIQSGAYEKILVIGSEVFSKIVNWEDRNTCILFGDGAGACVLERCETGYGILSFDLGADGTGGNTLIVPAGGSRTPTTSETLKQKQHLLQMDGKEVFKFGVRIMEKATRKALEKANLTTEDVDFLVPHQANIRIIDSATKKLKINPEKLCINLEKYGNMSSASIPVALEEVVAENKIKKGDIVVLVGFGAGLTWGSMAIRWSKGGGKH